MSEHEEPGGTVIELMLRDPEIVRWLEDYRPEAPEPEEDDEPPRAA